jgi:hypothetical protein
MTTKLTTELEGNAKRAFDDGVRDGGLIYSVSNIWHMSKHMVHYEAGFAIGSAKREGV